MINFNTQLIGKPAHPANGWRVRVDMTGSVYRHGVDMLSIRTGQASKGPP